MSEPLLTVQDLSVVYHVEDGVLPALHDVSFSLRRGEVLGIVGESGCGKSTLSSALMRLLPANGEVVSGEILFEGQNLRDLSEDKMRELCGSELTMVFQDPLTSLNPTFSVGAQLRDIQRAHKRSTGSSSDHRARSVEMLQKVGIPDAEDRLNSFPHEFSGGMRQRVMIAMALMLQPTLLIADEATTALDVTLQAQILHMLKDLCAENDTAVLFVSHDLGVVSQVCDRVLVMYAGRAVEEADVHTLFDTPLHPYTRGLLDSVPARKDRGRRLHAIPGQVPSLGALPSGCKFADRCEYVQPVDRDGEPRYLDLDGHRVRCNMYDPDSGYVGARAEARPPDRSERQVSR